MKRGKFRITKTLEIFFDENIHEYNLDISKKGSLTKYELKASNNGEWTEKMKGKTLMIAINDGEKISFQKPIGKHLNLAEAEHLRIILHIENIYSCPNINSKVAFETVRGEPILL